MIDDISPEDDRGIAAFMKTLAEASLPIDESRFDARTIWQKAQLMRRWRAEHRANVVLEAVDTVYVALGTAAAGLFVLWMQASLADVFVLIRL